MSRFIKRALEKLPKLNRTQVQELIREMAKENDLYESLLQSMTLGLMVTDSQHRILIHNKAAERFLPLLPDPVDRILWTAIADQDVAQFLKATMEGLETVSGKEFALAAPGQTVRTLLVGVTPLVKDGRIKGSLISLQDISERKNAQARLRRAETLASLTTLAAGVAHEIKNPLGSMGIHIQLIQKTLNRGGDIPVEQITRDLAVINEEINRLNGIVVDFLFAVRPMDTNLSPGSLGQMIQSLMDFLAPELAQAGITLVLDLDRGKDSIAMDERYLKQAVLNMVKNSIHAMPEGGTLTVRTKTGKEDVRMIIQDSGEGIPEENLEKVFEPYFTTKSFGSGLGLTLVFKIIKEHGGDIQIASQVGVGTTITVIFPLPRREPALLAFEGDLA